MTQASLFPETQEMAIARLDSQILDLMLGHNGGPLGLTLEEDEKSVLRAIRYMRGVRNAITIAELQKITNLSPREIKKSVRTLRMSFQLPIGSSKHSEHGGYFLIISAEDRSVWVGDVLDQVRAELAVLRAAAGPQATLELLGQLRAEVQ